MSHNSTTNQPDLCHPLISSHKLLSILRIGQCFNLVTSKSLNTQEVYLSFLIHLYFFLILDIKTKKELWLFSGPTSTVKLFGAVQCPTAHHKSPLDVSVSLPETCSVCFLDLFWNI